MLKSLLLKNLILVEEASIPFHEGLTVITGETGSGKTALVEGLKFVLGERSDTTKIRKGSDKAYMQASFQMDISSEMAKLFDEIGLEIASEEELIISREMGVNGKSRAFVNSQLVPLAFLQKLAPFLINFIGQHAHIHLRAPENQREILDQFAEIDFEPFRNQWDIEKHLLKEHEELTQIKTDSEKKRIFLEEQIEELQEANPQEGEEERLFEEYTFLSNSQDILEKTHQIEEAAEQSFNNCALSCSILSSIGRHHPLLEEAHKMAKEAEIQLKEVRRTLHSFQSKIENDPNRIAFLEERLKVLNKLKKKYGNELTKVHMHLKEELNSLENLDDKLKEIKKTLQQAQETTKKEVEAIRKKRAGGALVLEKLLTSQLRELNIPTAEVKITLIPTERSRMGEDTVTFFLRANRGEELSDIKTGTSGGELSRLLFSLSIALADKQKPTTLVFDEIDSNVGGETASIMGQKLHLLGAHLQILCITHFPQVAKSADQHLRISKEEDGERTRTQIEYLTLKQKEKELLRMVGGAPLSKR